MSPTWPEFIILYLSGRSGEGVGEEKRLKQLKLLGVTSDIIPVTRCISVTVARRFFVHIMSSIRDQVRLYGIAGASWWWGDDEVPRINWIPLGMLCLLVSPYFCSLAVAAPFSFHDVYCLFSGQWPEEIIKRWAYVLLGTHLMTNYFFLQAARHNRMIRGRVRMSQHPISPGLLSIFYCLGAWQKWVSKKKSLVWKRANKVVMCKPHRSYWPRRSLHFQFHPPKKKIRRSKAIYCICICWWRHVYRITSPALSPHHHSNTPRNVCIVAWIRIIYSHDPRPPRVWDPWWKRTRLLLPWNVLSGKWSCHDLPATLFPLLLSQHCCDHHIHPADASAFCSLIIRPSFTYKSLNTNPSTFIIKNDNNELSFPW